MIRRAGRIEPGSGATVFTGQSVLFLPARIALTSAMLSFFVRPETEGVVIGGAFGAESGERAIPLAVLEAVVVGVRVGEGAEAGSVDGVDVAVVTTFSGIVSVLAPGLPVGGIPSAPADMPSLLAAQAAREATRANEKSSE